MLDKPALQWFKTKLEDQKTFVFDPLRKKYCLLTPEEEVRQKVLYLLVEHLGVPSGLLAVEYSVKVNKLDKRCDAVVFGKDARPLMIVECKSSKVKITEKVLDQAIRYYSALCPKYLLLYNGKDCLCFFIDADTHRVSPTDHLPSYAEMMEL
jgi:hypothetical protein